ncbi:MAG: AraC family transcriptional regulator [Spirosomataceae bacterium]
MEDYNKIIESLGVKFAKSRHINILQPVEIKNFYDVENTILILYDGDVKVSSVEEKVEAGDLLFIPGGKASTITYGSGEAKKVSFEEFMTRREYYFDATYKPEEIGKVKNSIGLVAFEAKVFDSVNFFNSLDIPPFFIKNNEKLARLIKDILIEDVSDMPGRGRVIANKTYFKDPRLIDIFTYIKDNIDGDLSNKQLANVANVSEDYVGQYFKMLTGINPQDYIEYQRMEAAVNLLRTSKKSIRAIGAEVGYKDTAYFCRRFKMMFGIPAGKMRRRESLLIN